MLITPKQTNRFRTVGIMSGTSMDGIDTAVVDFLYRDGIITYELIAYHEYDYPEELKKKILYMLMGGLTLQDVASVNTYIAEICAEATLEILAENKISTDEIDFIGCHGQTLWHQPQAYQFCGKGIRTTFQALDAAALAHKTGISVISDFRSADMAASGQAAPLVPIFDYYFLSSDKHRAVLNIGGMSNVTLLPPCCERENIFAFDTGPGNVMIDIVVNKLYGKKYDAKGQIATSGTLIQDLFEELKSIPFILEKPPKSTGREYFSERYVSELLEKYRYAKSEDLVCTFSYFTAYAVAENIRLYCEAECEIICSGGGAKNKFIMSKIAELLPESRMLDTEALGLNPDAKEAIAFAFLAVLFATGAPGNILSVTGATKEKVLGSFTPA
jgi:anhydro-N-acetylmuramic acid kinase